MGGLLRQVARKATARASEKVTKIDMSNPVTQDTANWMLTIAKQAVDIFF